MSPRKSLLLSSVSAGRRRSLPKQQRPPQVRPAKLTGPLSRRCCDKAWPRLVPQRQEHRVVEARDAAEPLDEAELAIEGALRPSSLGEFVGQPKVRGQLQLLLDAARIQNRSPDHILLAGPPG